MKKVIAILLALLCMLSASAATLPCEEIPCAVQGTLFGGEAWYFTTALEGKSDALYRAEIGGEAVLVGEFPGIRGLDVYEGDAYIYVCNAAQETRAIQQISRDGEILHTWELISDFFYDRFDDNWLRDIAVTPDYIFFTDQRWGNGWGVETIETYIQGMELNKQTGERRLLPDTFMPASCDLTWSGSGNEVIVPFMRMNPFALNSTDQIGTFKYTEGPSPYLTGDFRGITDAYNTERYEFVANVTPLETRIAYYDAETGDIAVVKNVRMGEEYMYYWLFEEIARAPLADFEDCKELTITAFDGQDLYFQTDSGNYFHMSMPE